MQVSSTLSRQGTAYLRWAGLCLLLAVAFLLWWMVKPNGRQLELLSKTWRLDIEIEKLLEEGESSWCDEMPAAATAINRRPMVDPSGIRPAGAEHCRYNLPQWRTLRMARAEGEAPAQPQWPTPSLNRQAAQQLGAERAGKRLAIYELRLGKDAANTWACRLPLSEWQSHKVGASYRLQIDRFGVADCSTLIKLD